MVFIWFIGCNLCISQVDVYILYWCSHSLSQLVAGSGMSPTSYKAPPAFGEGMSYSDWKLDLELWKEFTTLDKKKQGTALLLELPQGKVKDMVRSLGKAVLIAEDGIAQILTHLDKIFLEDKALMEYKAYSRFEMLKREECMSLADFVSEFERLQADLKKFKINLPETVLAYRFLNSVNLPSEKIELALATVKAMTYKDVSTTVAKIFSVGSSALWSGPSTHESDGTVIKVEPEECNYAMSNSGKSSRRSWTRGREGVSFHPYVPKAPYSGCFNCGKKDHIVRYCPQRRRKLSDRNDSAFLTESGVDESAQMDTEEDIGHGKSYLILFSSDVGKSGVSPLTFETLACAVVDSGCTKSVVGRYWVEQYEHTLDSCQLAQMVWEDCNTPFKFGDGEEIMSRQKVKIPGKIGSRNVLIDACVVEKDLPLLLSSLSMKKAGAVIDFKSDRMRFQGQWVDLMETKSEHLYYVPLCTKRRQFTGPEHRRPNLVLKVTKEALLGKDRKQIRQRVTKLHRQFSHPPSDKLKTLLRNAGFERREYLDLIDEVSKGCEFCLRYKQAKARPAVGLPGRKECNEIEEMDSKDTPLKENSMQMQSDFSANCLPAWASTSNRTVTENVNAPVAVGDKGVFAEAEKYGKTQKASRCKDVTHKTDYFDKGDKVLFKMKGSLKWTGPGVILGREKTQYLVKHSNQYFRCNACHMMRANKEGHSAYSPWQPGTTSSVGDQAGGNPASCGFRQEYKYLENNEMSQKDSMDMLQNMENDLREVVPS